MTRKRALSVVVVALIALTVSLVAVPASGQVDYYNNSSSVVQPDSPRNATLQNIVSQAVALSPSIIGTGTQDPAGVGFQGVLLTGIVFGGVAVGAMAATGVGAIGALILSSVVSYGLVDLGFAPPWIKPLLLFGVGIMAFVSLKRVFQ